MVPNAPGGGYDVTARTAVSIAERSGITGERIAVFNLAGDQGMVALSRLLDESGNGRLAMMMGLGIVGATIATGSAHRVTDGTPIARLLQEPEAVLVPADSPYGTIDDLVRAWRANPAQVRIGGGSAVGGPDHLGTMQLAQAVGIEPRQVQYGTYDGGGALLPVLLDRRIDVAVSSMVEYAEQIHSGQLRVLAVSGPSRVAGVDAPTLTEAGIDVGVHQLARRPRATGHLGAGPGCVGRAVPRTSTGPRNGRRRSPRAARPARSWPATTSAASLPRRTGGCGIPWPNSGLAEHPPSGASTPRPRGVVGMPRGASRGCGQASPEGGLGLARVGIGTASNG